MAGQNSPVHELMQSSCTVKLCVTVKLPGVCSSTVCCVFFAVCLTGEDYEGDELHSVQPGHSSGSDYPAGEFHHSDRGD